MSLIFHLKNKVFELLITLIEYYFHILLNLQYSETVELSCLLGNKNIRSTEFHPQSYAIHTHHLASYFEAYKVSKLPGNDEFTWELIGNGDPRLVKNVIFDMKNKRMVFKSEDYIAVRCVFNNTLSHSVKIGYRDDEEMCMFVMQISISPNESLYSINSCSSDPRTSWFDSFNSLP
jgi:hypothetical protein